MRVHDSQAYRKMDVTREHICRILEMTEILLSFQTGFNLVSAAIAHVLSREHGYKTETVLTFYSVLSVRPDLFIYSQLLLQFYLNKKKYGFLSQSVQFYNLQSIYSGRRLVRMPGDRKMARTNR